MKKYYVAIAFAAFSFAACKGGNENKDTKAGAPAAGSEASISNDPDYEKGLTLVGNSDCLTCHKVSEKLTGPAYRDVAQKYENNDENVAMLAGKIIKGGSGNWGPIPMTPHPALSEGDAKQMVKYILLLRNK